MMDRRLIENFDWSILLVFLAIIVVGLFTLYSALYQQIQADATHNLFIRQIFWLVIGLAFFAGSLLLDYQKLKQISLWFYLGVVFLLILVLGFGTEVNGAKRWLSLAGIRFQPSELMKLIIIVQLASYFSSHEIKTYPRLKDLLPPLCATLVPVCLILAEPDLGTALMVLIAAATLIYFMGVRTKYILVCAVLITAMIWPVWNYVLKPYQKERILILLSPGRDPLGAGYHIRQSKIAIGSGKLWGKGFLRGTQNKLRFLPEKHTDFIFSVLAEEWGFLGCSLLLGLFSALVYLAFRVARRSKDRFGALLVIGLTGLILWQMVINIGMVLGLMPVVGIPLPFVSYGGSSLVTLCIAVGLIENVSMRRYVFQSQWITGAFRDRRPLVIFFTFLLAKFRSSVLINCPFLYVGNVLVLCGKRCRARPWVGDCDSVCKCMITNPIE